MSFLLFQLEELSLNYFLMYAPKHARTFVVFVQVKRVQGNQLRSHYIIRVVFFTELSKILWFKVVTSVKEMDEEGNLFMEDFLKMRVLLLNTTKNFSCLWPTEGRIQMVHSSS
uniref:Uncharacterized protein n=1 Tax=Ursus americanus TaxID=9643 RepID=A0A452RXC7_URSAM